jgi:hypothetical protein
MEDVRAIPRRKVLSESWESSDFRSPCWWLWEGQCWHACERWGYKGRQAGSGRPEEDSVPGAVKVQSPGRRELLKNSSERTFTWELALGNPWPWLGD